MPFGLISGACVFWPGYMRRGDAGGKIANGIKSTVLLIE
jgi:hypothetical protein